MTAFPKPTKRKKEPKPLKAKRWGVSRSKRGSAHRNRDRELGRMLYLHEEQDCDVVAAYIEEFGSPIVATAAMLGECEGRREVMHLVDDGGYRAPDENTAKGCKKHHTDMDGKVGGKGPWFVALGRDRQRRLQLRLVARADAHWFGLSAEVRARYDERAATRGA